MKVLIVGILFMNLFAITAIAQIKPDAGSVQSIKSDTLIVEASCGQCNFDLPGKGCDLAVRINGKAYYVDGTDIDEHGDAHADDGFCEAIRTAQIKGDVVGDRFKVKYFKLIPLDDE